MIRAVTRILGVGLCVLTAPAMANLSLVNYNGFEIRQSGNTWTFSHEPPSSTVLRGGTVLPNAAVSSSQRALVVAKTIPVGRGLPVDVVAKIPAANLARAIVGFGRIATPIGAAITAVELIDYFKDNGITDVKNTANGLVGKVNESGDSIISDGYEYGITGQSQRYPTVQQGCAAMMAYVQPGMSWVQLSSPYAQGLNCYAMGNGQPWTTGTLDRHHREDCPAGYYISGSTCSKDPIDKEISEQQLLDRIATASGWPTSAAIAAQKAINMGIPVQTEPPTVSGPSSVAGERSTKSESVNLNPGTNIPSAPGAANSDPGTKTTTTTTTTNASYSGPSVTTTTTINTVTNITNNITNITTTTTTNEVKENDQPPVDPDREPDKPPVDTPLGDVPELYIQKYPDGISGVLNTKFGELKATPLFNLPSLLMPALPSSGSCPSWQVDLSLAGWADMGSHTIQAPCMVWDFGKVVILISALLLARRLIFGG